MAAAEENQSYSNHSISSKSSIVCPICCENYNKSNHKKLICPKPDCCFDCCSTCVKTFILDNSSNPTCMNCKTILSDQYIVDNINRTFYMGEFKKKLGDKLFENEQSKMPETMPFVKQRIEIKKIEKQNVLIKKEIDELNALLNKKKAEMYINNSKIWTITNGSNKDNQDKYTFIVPCRNNGCKGFLNKKYRCELCDTHTCSKCLEFIGKKDTELYNNHECKKENIESAEMIRKDTKPCPKCGTRIYKIDGCDQMWCTECKVAFSWKKGTIVTGTIHNPHYYQWIKNDVNNNNRNPLDVICGGLQNFTVLRNAVVNLNKQIALINSKTNTIKNRDHKLVKEINRLFNHLIQNTIFKGFIYNRYHGHSSSSSNYMNTIPKIHQIFNHIINYEIPDIVTSIQTLQDNRNLRVNFMLDEITRDSFKTTIMKNHIDLNIKQQELLLYQLIRNFGIDLFNEFVQIFSKIQKTCSDIVYDDHNEGDAYNILFATLIDNLKEIENYWEMKNNEITNLCKYFNQEMRKISITYNRSVKVFKNSIFKTCRMKFNIKKIREEELKILQLGNI